jgi:hypothetical protein
MLLSAAAYDNSVVPINWSSFTSGNPTDSRATRLVAIQKNTNKYLLNTWWHEKKNYDAQTGEYMDFGGWEEGKNRPPAMASLALATSIALGIYDASYTGVSLTEAKAKTIRLIKSLAFRHHDNPDNTGTHWGDFWQSPLWANHIGMAAWLLWDDLSAADREYVRKCVVWEANRFLNSDPDTYRDRDGSIVSPGDSKGESIAWNGAHLQLVAAMMPNHENNEIWWNQAVKFAIVAFSRPSDVNNTTRINGKRVTDYLVHGTNIEEYGQMVNHERIHPDYTACLTLNTGGAIMFTLAGMPTPQAFFFNADIVYESIVDHNFSSPPYDPPGGTMYVDGEPYVYFPQGNDWGSSRRMNYVLLDANADVFGFDSLASQSGGYWEDLHAGDALAMQERFTDGHTYKDYWEDKYYGCEEWVAVNAAKAYWVRWTGNQTGEFVVTNSAYIAPSSDTSPPSAPTGLQAQAGSDRTIHLSWSAATDAQSGIAAYVIYRDNTEAGRTQETSFTDSGLTEKTTYRYEVSALNNSMLEGSRSSSVDGTTLADTASPAISSVSTGSATEVRIVFNEPVGQQSAQTAANYSIDNDISVGGASLGADLKTVTLTVSDLSKDITYTLAVRNVTDRASSPNQVAATTTAQFTYVDPITKIRFYPRDGWSNRMLGGVFEATSADKATGPYVTLFTIESEPAQGQWTEVTNLSNGHEPYRYVRYRSAPDGFCNIAEIEIYRGE